MKDFSKLCTPARVYFAIAVIASVIALFNHVSILAVFTKLVFAFIWTFILSWLCDKGYKMLSWFLVLLPYLIILLGILGIMHVSQSHQNMMRAVRLQGAFGREGLKMKKHL
jgi:hypothetical protein